MKIEKKKQQKKQYKKKNNSPIQPMTRLALAFAAWLFLAGRAAAVLDA
jgi:hypothetical protein